MTKDREWLDMWDKKALIEDEYLCVGRDTAQDVRTIFKDLRL